ncbi:glycosyltransferase [Amnibacterium sp. CER49]|nr:glycosyltransferase [Amnibacterium sp. CER49]MDH2443437.1 glycosyltransferase [Amnibacterium sp. CER49]
MLRLARELTGAGAVVRLVHTGATPAGVRGVSVGRRWSPVALLRARRALAGADVVSVQFAPSMYGFRAWVGLLPLAAGRRPIVPTLHEYGWWTWARQVPRTAWRALEPRRLVDRETALLVPRAARVVVTNAAHAEDVRRRFPDLPVVAIPIGANVAVATSEPAEVLRPSVRVELGVAPDAVLLAFFGFVHPVKGIRYLGEAVARLAAEGRDVHLLVVGGFESTALPAAEALAFEAELRAHLAAAGAGDRARITGFLPEEAASRLLAAADVAVLPFTAGVTTKSGSLLTVLAHGLPTVVTAAPEPDPELVDGATCVVVPAVRDAPALADGIRRVLDDPALATRIAAAGRALAARRDWPDIAARHLALLAEVAR